MIIMKERLIELLHHEDKRVRDASVRALEKYFPGSDGIIEHLLKSISTYENDCLSLAANIKSFLPTNTDIHKIINLFNETSNLDDEYSSNINYHLILSLLSFPFEIIENNRETFVFNDELIKIYEQNKISDEIRSQNPEILWNELERICTNYHGKKLNGEDRRYAELLFEGLKKHPDQIKHKIIMFLSHETKENYHMEEFMVRLAGALEIEETIPYLFRIFNDSTFMHFVHDSCIKSLGKIGTLQVVNEIEKQYDPKNDLRDELACILGYIPYSFSENLLIRLLKEEKNISIRTLLADGLCDMFSIEATDLIINTIENKQYDPQMNNLCDALTPVYVYHNKTFDFSFLKSIEDDYVKETLEKDPIHKMLEPLRKAFQQFKTETERKKDSRFFVGNNKHNIIEFKESIPKVGRNDPCPCGSGKKYKKCCLRDK